MVRANTRWISLPFAEKVQTIYRRKNLSWIENTNANWQVHDKIIGRSMVTKKFKWEHYFNGSLAEENEEDDH